MSATTRPAPYTDHCPQCDTAVACRPLGLLETSDGVTARYRCPRCAHTWRTGWQRQPEENR